MSRGRFAIRRMATFPVQILGVVTLIFFVVHVLPGSPVFKQLGLFYTPEQVDAATEQLGLDRPLLEQYGDFLSDLVRADLGTSFVTSKPVTEDLLDVFPATLELAIASLLIALVLGGIFGIVSGMKARGPVAGSATAYRLVAGAVPEFWLGLILVYVFVTELGIAPGPTGQLASDLPPPPRVTGMIVVDSAIAGDWPAFRSALAHLALPALALGFSIGGPIARLLRILVADSRHSDYAQYGRMAGLRRRTLVGYGVRSAIVPLTTLLAVLTVIVMSQSVAVEIVFAWGGLGQYTVAAVQSSDYAAIQGVVLATTTFVLFVYLVTDLIQATLDPRLVDARPSGPGGAGRVRRVLARPSQGAGPPPQSAAVVSRAQESR